MSKEWNLINTEAILEVAREATCKAALEGVLPYVITEGESHHFEAIQDGRWDDNDCLRFARIAVEMGISLGHVEHTSVGWLIEMIEPEENRPPAPRYWHPDHGWMWDADKALRFVREEDAVAYINHGTGVGAVKNPFIRGKATKHSWHVIPDPEPGDDQ